MPASATDSAMTMKAIVQREYGPPDVLHVEDVARPEVGDGDVLIRVRAASLNQGDWHLMRGLPYLVRLMGLRRPKHPVPGQYAAGTIEAVGKDVTQFQPGDEVFGSCKGAFAEYVRAGEDAFAPKPHNLTFEQAAAVPHGGFAALQALRAGKVQAGQKVLILGASGAVGTMAVQIAKVLGADVTGVCSTAKVDMVRGLGADRVLDYTKEDFAEGDARYDLILDMVGNRPASHYRRALAPAGKTVMVSSGKGRWLGGMDRVLRAALTSLFSGKKLLPFLATDKKEDLLALKGLIEDGKVTPPVDRTFPLAETPEAFRHLETGNAKGMIVVTV